MKNRYLKCPKCGHKMRVDKTSTSRSARKSGTNYEYSIVKKLNKLCGFKRGRGQFFARTPRSGGGDIPGDIFMVNGYFPCIIECKFKDTISVTKLLRNPNLLYDTKKDEPLASKGALLVFKDGTKDYVVAHTKDIKDMEFLEENYVLLNYHNERYMLAPLEKLFPYIKGLHDEV